MRRNNKYKSIYNKALDLIDGLPLAHDLPTEAALADRLIASRTTIRAVLSHLAQERIIDWSGRKKLVLRRPVADDYYVFSETQSTDQIIETEFMQWILSGDVDEGTTFTESELARNFNVSTSAVREFLIRFSRFSLIEKQNNRGWVLNGFTKEFALELSEIREMFELRSIAMFVTQDVNAPCWEELDKIEERHLALLGRIDDDFLKFSALDDAFHSLINSVSENRFVTDFHDLISIIFHYHYRWNKWDERERNEAAVNHHLEIIKALKARDPVWATKACRSHLEAARTTLLKSIRWK